ncbi:MAG: redox-regulated ATPase YchF [Proteobacteria bacterium]|jgi:GTP-binding protein YchF|nr:redox-regulated ATPase YchF [SAR324 cluster bacterium]RZO47387.1 MAG: redox-regulated ATPase YchF [Pseudomonadota bacterium]HJL93720.1 redox-regulated ATPase YchF [SAR324 cluster bacterium]|tara:strand:+ start:17 stop:1108 length:1092 start_codon:yes stop_codon:yes gene_type:complete
MALEVGIVGLPNIGKSTLFSSLTKVKAVAANYPFCTIDPNIGIVQLRDPRMKRLIELVTPDRIVPATLQVVDIAGLVKGASQGEGLGNKFLSHIRQVHAVAHVVRCFEDQNVVHVEGLIDPIRDVEVIQTELILSDLEQTERKIERLSRQLKSDSSLAPQITIFERLRDFLGEGKFARRMEFSEEERTLIAELNLLTMKPYLYIANISEDGLKNQEDHLERLNELALAEGVEVIPICAQVESELAEMEDEESELFMEELGINSSGLDQLTNSGYRMLDQITYFTAGKQEVRAWEIRKGTTAPEAAGKIHTDFEKGFIRAEVFHFDDIDRLGSESSIKEAGKWRLEGREYVVQDGDIMHFRFNV